MASLFFEVLPFLSPHGPPAVDSPSTSDLRALEVGVLPRGPGGGAVAGGLGRASAPGCLGFASVRRSSVPDANVPRERFSRFPLWVGLGTRRLNQPEMVSGKKLNFDCQELTLSLQRKDPKWVCLFLGTLFLLDFKLRDSNRKTTNLGSRNKRHT